MSKKRMMFIPGNGCCTVILDKEGSKRNVDIYGDYTWNDLMTPPQHQDERELSLNIDDLPPLSFSPSQQEDKKVTALFKCKGELQQTELFVKCARSMLNGDGREFMEIPETPIFI